MIYFLKINPAGAIILSTYSGKISKIVLKWNFNDTINLINQSIVFFQGYQYLTNELVNLLIANVALI